MTEYRYYGGEDRKKRTAMSYNRPTYSKRELSLTTDDVIALLSLMQQQQPQPPQPSQKQLNIYNPYLQRYCSHSLKKNLFIIKKN